MISTPLLVGAQVALAAVTVVEQLRARTLRARLEAQVQASGEEVLDRDAYLLRVPQDLAWASTADVDLVIAVVGFPHVADRHFVERFRGAMRAHEVMYRVGEHQLAVVLWGVDADGARTAIARILSRCVTESITGLQVGYAPHPRAGRTASRLLRAARRSRADVSVTPASLPAGVAAPAATGEGAAGVDWDAALAGMHRADPPARTRHGRLRGAMRSRANRTRAAAVLLSAIVLFAARFAVPAAVVAVSAPVPFWVERPGPLASVHVRRDGRATPLPGGGVRFPTVEVFHPRRWRWWQARVHGRAWQRTADDVGYGGTQAAGGDQVPAGVSPRVRMAIEAGDADARAIAAAGAHAGRDWGLAAAGATVARAGCLAGRVPALAGVVAVNGQDVADASAASRALETSASAARPGSLGLADGSTVELPGGSCTSHLPVLVDRHAVMPDPGITIDASVRHGGNSAGLAEALDVWMVLTGTDLVRGRRIVATGAITPEGLVLQVLGVRSKGRAARDGHADILLVPAGLEPLARAGAGSRVRVVGVRSLDAAIDELRRR